jgi:spore coat protein U-like protein
MLLGELVIDCNNLTPSPVQANLALAISVGRSGSYAQRHMTSAEPAPALLYNVCHDSSCFQPWTDRTTDFGAALQVPGSGSARARFPVFVRIPGSQTTVPVGAFSDTLRVMLSY